MQDEKMIYYIYETGALGIGGNRASFLIFGVHAIGVHTLLYTVIYIVIYIIYEYSEILLNTHSKNCELFCR